MTKLDVLAGNNAIVKAIAPLLSKTPNAKILKA
jgi:hypothetical protein